MIAAWKSLFIFLELPSYLFSTFSLMFQNVLSFAWFFHGIRDGSTFSDGRLWLPVDAHDLQRFPTLSASSCRMLSYFQDFQICVAYLFNIAFDLTSTLWSILPISRSTGNVLTSVAASDFSSHGSCGFCWFHQFQFLWQVRKRFRTPHAQQISRV